MTFVTPAELPDCPLLKMEYATVMPDAVIAGLPSWVEREHDWAGLTVGWVHKSVSLLCALTYGRGQIVITTFKLNETTLATDTIAQAIFAGILNMLNPS